MSDDYTITLMYPFAMDNSMHNLILCQACGRVNYASEMFGIDADKGLSSTGYHWLKGLVHGSKLEDPHEDMVCPTCGARKESNLGRAIMNFLIGESAREHVYPRHLALPV